MNCFSCPSHTNSKCLLGYPRQKTTLEGRRVITPLKTCERPRTQIQLEEMKVNCR